MLDKIFNLNDSEWGRVTSAWLIRFFYRVGFVVGWTVIVAMFVGRYGIKMLPFLFVINAVFTVIGSLLYSTFLDKFSKPWLLSATIFIASASLLFSAIFFPDNQVMFFSFLVVTEAIFLVQLKMLMDGYVEELFTPLESERTFPFIEAADTIGGILAGLIVVFLSSGIETSNFVYLWVGLLLLIIPVLLVYEHFMAKETRMIGMEEHKSGSSLGILSKLKKEFSNAKHVSFIKGLFLIVFLHWMLFNLLEFQYTKAVYQNVSAIVVDTGSGFEHALVHDLGQLFILFSSSALLIQLFIGSRLINSLGVMGSMLLHPLITLFSLLGFTLGFGFPTAVLAKNNFTISTVIYTNVYHSSYYAIREHLREHAREFMEGILRPLGAIAATFLLILIQKFFIDDAMILPVNILMIATCLALFVVTFRQQDKYTEAAVFDLLHSKDKKERMNAVDILAQRGHKSSPEVLGRMLLDEKESVSLRLASLRALSSLQDISSIPDVLKCFSDPHVIVREAALDTMISFSFLKKLSKKHLFMEYEIVEALKDLYRRENSESVRSKIIKLLATLSPVGSFDFLLNVLNSSKGDLKADAIFALGNYKDDRIFQILKPYLNSKSYKYRLNAAIALGRLKGFEDEVLGVVYSLLNSTSPKEIADALYAIGELKLKRQKKTCFKYIDSKNLDLRMQSAIALAKMGNRNATFALIDILFNSSPAISNRVKKLLKNVDVRIYRNIDKIVKHVVNMEVEKLLNENKEKTLNQFEQKDLIALKWLYGLVDEYDEVEIIDRFIKS